MARLVDLNKQLGGTIAREVEAILVGPMDARTMGEIETLVDTKTEYWHLAADSGLTGISAGGNIDLVKYYFRLPHCES